MTCIDTGENQKNCNSGDGTDWYNSVFVDRAIGFVDRVCPGGGINCLLCSKHSGEKFRLERTSPK